MEGLFEEEEEVIVDTTDDAEVEPVEYLEDP